MVICRLTSLDARLALPAAASYAAVRTKRRYLGEARRVASTVTIPLWLAVLLGVLAVVALIDRLFGPALGWWLQAARQSRHRRVEPAAAAEDPAVQAGAAAPADRAADVRSRYPARRSRTRPRSAASPSRSRTPARAATPRRSSPRSAPTPISASAPRLARRLSTALYRVRLGALDEAEALPGAG